MVLVSRPAHPAALHPSFNQKLKGIDRCCAKSSAVAPVASPCVRVMRDPKPSSECLLMSSNCFPSFPFRLFFLKKKADEEWPQKWNRKKTKGANNVRARLRGGEYFIVSCLHIIDQGAFLLLLLLPIFGGGGGGEYLSPIRKIGREALQ